MEIRAANTSNKGFVKVGVQTDQKVANLAIINMPSNVNIIIFLQPATSFLYSLL